MQILFANWWQKPQKTCICRKKSVTLHAILRKSQKSRGKTLTTNKARYDDKGAQGSDIYPDESVV